jgi:hypothetical protein
LRTIDDIARLYEGDDRVSIEYVLNRKGKPFTFIQPEQLPEGYSEGDVRAAIEAGSDRQTGAVAPGTGAPAPTGDRGRPVAEAGS